MRYFLLYILLLTPTCFAQQENPKFYDQRSKGWFWHEPEPEPVPEPERESLDQKQPDTPANEEPTQQPSTVTLDSAWLKANLEKLTTKAIDNPTPENLAAYAYAQRLMMDLGSRFSTKMTEFMTLEQQLQESNRRPFSAFALNEFADERNKTKLEIMQQLKENTHLWFFYSSTCSFCMKQLPVLNELQRLTNIPIMAISMDGGLLPGMENMELVYDEDLRVSQMFNVTSTPTMFMVVNKDRTPIPLTIGLNSLDEIEKRLLLISRQAGVITEDQFQLAKEVRDIGIFTNSTGEIVADRSRLESDPKYLAELLRRKLEESQGLGGSTAVSQMLKK